MDLADMLKQWETIEFPITLYKDTDIKVLGNIEDIQVCAFDSVYHIFILEKQIIRSFKSIIGFIFFRRFFSMTTLSKRWQCADPHL